MTAERQALSDLSERVARALWEVHRKRLPGRGEGMEPPWGDRESGQTLEYYEQAEAVLALFSVYDCPDAEVCKSCTCAGEDDVCFPAERLRVENEAKAKAITTLEAIVSAFCKAVGEPIPQDAISAAQRLREALEPFAALSCREWCHYKTGTCDAPAEFVLWGKLIPAGGLGPRCYDHAAEHVGHRALGDPSWAIVDLRPARRALGAASDEEGRTPCGCGNSGVFDHTTDECGSGASRETDAPSRRDAGSVDDQTEETE